MRLLVAVLALALAATFWTATARADGISYTGGRFMFECGGQFAGFIKKIKSDNAPPTPAQLDSLDLFADKCGLDIDKWIEDIVRRGLEEPQRTESLREADTCKKVFQRVAQHTRDPSALLRPVEKDCCGDWITGDHCWR